ncbi:hypothetical protein [Halomonas stenophila]|uniref:Uncharacterized protein n=1 Tax=Halomonas stenophila TaxID=795312 RepID=A0A7W5HMR0_9GAMM|nr:hypothetical protein [Halomonas stenophila]MBB3232903.1 hypothetical protein [Halomonas stenophila]
MFQSLTWERRHPYIMGVLAFAGAYGLAYYGVSLPKETSFFSAVITLGGIFSAFSVTIKSLILSNQEKIQSLKETGYHDDFMRYLAIAIDGSLFLCLAGLLGFFKPLASTMIFTPLVIGLLVFSLLAIRRVTMASSAVLKQPKRKRAG